MSEPFISEDKLVAIERDNEILRPAGKLRVNRSRPQWQGYVVKKLTNEIRRLQKEVADKQERIAELLLERS